MNYLAHLYLSGNSEGLVIGNFIADAVKGSDLERFPDEVRKGILLHRSIDVFTDNHPVVGNSIKRLRPEFRKYAGVVSDVFYDHFLAKKWKNYNPKDLQEFSKEIYDLLDRNANLLPPRSARFLAYMKKYDILNAYSTFGGMNRALTGLSDRTTFNSGMENAVKELKRGYCVYERDFEEFFPLLIVHSEKVIKSLP